MVGVEEKDRNANFWSVTIWQKVSKNTSRPVMNRFFPFFGPLQEKLLERNCIFHLFFVFAIVVIVFFHVCARKLRLEAEQDYVLT